MPTILNLDQLREQLGARIESQGAVLHKAELGRSHEHGKLFLLASVTVDGVLHQQKVHIPPSLRVTGYHSDSPLLLAGELLLKCKEAK